MISVNPMLPSDLEAVLDVQKACYHEIEPESEQSIRAKLLASPHTCFTAYHAASGTKNTLAGYMLAFPVVRQELPPLNACECQMPDEPDCLYLHDMAVLPPYRSEGVGAQLFQAFKNIFDAHAFEYAALIAIQDSVPYWQKRGFMPVQTSLALQNKLLSYGGQARYMEMYQPRKT